MATRRHPHLLEISAWPWLERLSRERGRTITLANVPAEVWSALEAKGFDLIYLMGVWERSPLGRTLALGDPGLRSEYDRVLPGWTDADVPGSPYCISAYIPDLRMGGWAGVDTARAELHARGMTLMVDFVPNHTAFDHPWVLAHPDWYVLGEAAVVDERPEDFRQVGDVHVACGRDPYFAPWRDVAQLNYFNPAARAAMIDVLHEISAHADGVRCDMAMLVLNDVFERTWRSVLKDAWPAPALEFWPTATASVPSLMYLAEVYWDREWTLQQQGFHFTYDKRLLDRLHGAPPSDVRAHLLADAGFSARLARFIENHDEPRSAAALGSRLPAAAAMVATLPGMRFFFDGQFDGAQQRAPVQLGRWPDEPGSVDIRALYDQLMRAAGDDLFHTGEWSLLHVLPAGNTSHDALVAWQWRDAEGIAVVVVNLGAATADGHIGLPGLPPRDAWTFDDQLTGAEYHWTGADLVAHGLYVRLEAGRAQLLTAPLAPVA